ncbi:phytanoyl-CoA dioxygenase family protein [Phenylobacterium sp.]|uniref:phytanoyl-CoA dioxygenase family protein n=1 Tax=Phenylobacterium sp. TaxID=1871053 RepID=UPI002737CA22|nr:phytanoyl-CoA dioxygenase family protein [Phenylobacterium sp.]MDP3868553.1 phytanoyl-CoA dioxygenase family protein [Phenylobacterium sp.]
MNKPLQADAWTHREMDIPEILALRSYLEANNGIKGLDILEPGDTEHAVNLFRRDGFVVIANVLTSEQTDFLAKGCNAVAREILALDGDRAGNRGSHRYSFGGSSLTRSQLHRPEWQMLLDIPAVTEIVTAIFESPNYVLRAASGDFCLPGAVEYQPLHADVNDWRSDERTPFSAYHDPRGQVTIRDLPCPYVCVNFLPQDVTRLNGPTRQIPGTQNSRVRIPRLDDEPEWMRLSTVCPAPAGGIMIRDVRAWHGGTPNVSDSMRAIPNLEFYAPWFREPIVPGITYEDYRKLSEHAQRLVRHCVADSSETLVTGPTLRAP